MVALLPGPIIYGLIAIVERVKWRVLMIAILSTLSLGCAHSLSRFSIGTLSLWLITHFPVLISVTIYPKS